MNQDFSILGKQKTLLTWMQHDVASPCESELSSAPAAGQPVIGPHTHAESGAHRWLHTVSCSQDPLAGQQGATTSIFINK